jgi:hypothetical protein
VDAFWRATERTPEPRKITVASVDNVSRRPIPHTYAAILGRIASVRPARTADRAPPHRRRSAPAAHTVQTRGPEPVPLDEPSELRPSHSEIARKHCEGRLSTTPVLPLLRSVAADLHVVRRMASHDVEKEKGVWMGVCLWYKLSLGKAQD